MKFKSRILAIDHFFDQDLEQMQISCPPGTKLQVVGYQRLAVWARLCFPRRAFSGLSTAYEPSMRMAWRVFDRISRNEAKWLYWAYQPNVLVLPSDSIFYFRSFISQMREFGLRIVVLQKETTVTELTMRDHAIDVKTWVPPMFDASTMCSTRQRQFWINAGGDPDKIWLTGQPRFDFYNKVSSKAGRCGRPKLLYLSFDDKAYLPDDHGVTTSYTWVDLRQSVENVLVDFSEDYEILVKHHPQQERKDFFDSESLRSAPGDADTRLLILDADLVVGFQTTALFEALIAGVPALYCGYGSVHEQFKESLIPFHVMEGNISHADSEESLRSFLTSFLRVTTDGIATQSPISAPNLDEWIGPRDGSNSTRVWSVLEAEAARSNQNFLPKFPSRLEVLTRALLSSAVSTGCGIASKLNRQKRMKTKMLKIRNVFSEPISREAKVLQRLLQTNR